MTDRARACYGLLTQGDTPEREMRVPFHAAALAVVLGFVIPSVSHAAPSVCDGTAGNLVTNCGFETNTGPIPVGWTPDAGYLLHAGLFNLVTGANPNSGSNALQFGNFNTEPPAGISQTLATVAGDTYTETFWVMEGVPRSSADLFQATVDGLLALALHGNFPGIGNYTQFTIPFIGTGSDTIGFKANSQSAEWFLDDIVVLDTSQHGNVPEPASLVLLATGLLSLGVGMRARKR